MKRRRTTSSMGLALALAAAVVSAPFVLLPMPAWAAVNCAAVTATDPTDSDGDGFTDFQECSGIATVGVTPRFFPRCTSGPQEGCVEPNTKDVFVCLRKQTTGSLLDVPGYTVGFGDFLGTLSPLGISAHGLTPDQAGIDRTVVASPAYPSGVAPQKCVRVAESQDTNGTILGSCTWGPPGGLDGCTVFTVRMRNFVNATCDAARDTTSDRNAILKRLIVWGAAHETGHALGGLTSSYNSSYGGYHYKTGTPYVMQQSPSYTTKGGVCTFSLPTGWNTTLDPPSVRLK